MSTSNLFDGFELPLSEHIKRLESQVAQNVIAIRRKEGFLPSRTDTNPSRQVGAITVRSGKHLTQNVKESITIDEFTEIKKNEKDKSNPIVLDDSEPDLETPPG